MSLCGCRSRAPWLVLTNPEGAPGGALASMSKVPGLTSLLQQAPKPIYQVFTTSKVWQEDRGSNTLGPGKKMRNQLYREGVMLSLSSCETCMESQKSPRHSTLFPTCILNLLQLSRFRPHLLFLVTKEQTLVCSH